jgi:membrane protease YdiL (CAAX protease family)
LPLGVLLAVAAAFREEIEFRLGLLSVLAWLIGQLLRVARPNGRSVSLWSANLLQAMAFGAVHLAFGAGSGGAALSLSSTVLDPRTISGVILGYAFFSDGLETAIAAHAFRNAAISGLASLFARF